MDAYYFDSGGVLDVEEGAEVVDEVGDGVVAVEEVKDDSDLLVEAEFEKFASKIEPQAKE